VSGDCCCGRIKSSNDFAAEILSEHGRGCRSQRRAARRRSAAGRQAGARAPAARVAFLIGLSELGFAVGQDVSIEYRWLPSPLAPAAEALMDFTRTNVDVIVAVGTPATLSTGDQRGRAAGDNEGQRQRAFGEVPAARRVSERWPPIHEAWCTHTPRPRTRTAAHATVVTPLESVFGWHQDCKRHHGRRQHRPAVPSPALS